jgi:hypothetical protein
MSDYYSFLDAKAQLGQMDGFNPVHMPEFLFDFQQSLVDWALRKGRSAIFADCGLGKTPMQLVWADNVVRKTNRPVLILTPLAVSYQTCMEAEKFGIEATRRIENPQGIVVTNYEKLKHFNPNDFAGVVCDESGILKNFEGERRKQITDFMKKMQYRLLCTATAAPNDYIELGTSSEALGELGYTDMLTRFFKNAQGTIKPVTYRNRGKDFKIAEEGAKWRFKGHAEVPFWRWVCSWARAVRKPSDLGFADDRYILPPLIERDFMIDVDKPAEGFLFSLPAVGLAEQRSERRRTIDERCEKSAELALAHKGQTISWCHLNSEADMLIKLIPGSLQVSGHDSDEAKEEKFIAFSKGELKKLVTKPTIGAWGLNFQNCQHMTTFPSHSFEQYYQTIRRCWRFGQTKPVTVDMITTEGEKSVLQNLQRKAVAADKMFAGLVEHMQESMNIARASEFSKKQELPEWL